MSCMDGNAATDSGTAQKIVRKLVEIPTQVLDATDCEERWRLPPSLSPLTERALQFKVPPSAGPGSVLRIPVDASTTVPVDVPAYAVAGDVLRITQRKDGSWLVQRLLQEFSFLVPECAPGDVLKVPGPECRILSFPVPQGLGLGELITLKRGEQGWTFDKVRTLPSIGSLQHPGASKHGPYLELLNMLSTKGYTRGLPTGPDGTLHVNVPFCGRLHEYPILGKFLADILIAEPSLIGVQVLATEICSDYYYDWAIAERWYREYHPNITLKTFVTDLAEDPLPGAGLTIAIHPEVTKGGRWFQIIGSLIRSSKPGVCLLATFYEVEMQTVVNMVRMNMVEGAEIEVVENPYYSDQADLQHPPMRYLIIVSSK